MPVRYDGPNHRLVIPGRTDTVLDRGGAAVPLAADVVDRLKADPTVAITIDPQGE